MINKEKKRKNINYLIDIFSKNETIYLFDMSKLKCNQIFEIRKHCYKHDIKIKIVKNSLLKKSIQKINDNNFSKFIPFLKGNTSIFISNKYIGNNIAKIIKTFRKKENIKYPILKAAYFQDLFYVGDDKLKIILHIKSKEELIFYIINYLQLSMKQIMLSFIKIKNNVHELLTSILNKKQ